jgi:hypothetical protein
MSERDDIQSGRETTISALYRAQAREVPPASLDEAILAAARQEARAQPEKPKPLIFSVWRVPLAAVAVLVLSVTLTTLVIEHKEAVQSVFYGPSEIITEERTLQDTATLPAREAREAGTPSDEPEPAALDAVRAPASPAKEKKTESSASRQYVQARLKHQAEPAPSTQATKTPTPSSARMENARAPAKALEARPPPGLDSSTLKMQSADETTAQTMPAPAEEARQGRPPEEWLIHVRDLLKHGRRQDAVTSLTEFRKRYPDYRLPEDLRGLKQE